MTFYSITKSILFFDQYLISKAFHLAKKDEFENLNSIYESFLFNHIPVSEWIKYSQEIKEKIEKICKNDSGEHIYSEKGLEELYVFLIQVIKMGFQENIEKTLLFITEIISFEYLEAVAKWKNPLTENPKGIYFENVFQWNAASIPPHKQSTDFSFFSFKSTLRKCNPIYLYFIPHLINTLVDFFNLQDFQTRYTSRYEKYIMIDLFCKIFIFPQTLIHLFKPYFKTTLKVYSFVACAICVFGAFMYAYQRWLRPIPLELMNCQNMDRKKELGKLDSPVGQIRELDTLLEHLGNNRSVLITGSSGIGKTALTEHLCHIKSLNRLPANLQNRTIHEFNCGIIISNYQKDQRDQVKQTRNQLLGYEDKAILAGDEFGRLVKNDHAFNEFKNELMNSKPNILLICVLTEKERDEMIKNISSSETFLRRVKELRMQEPSDLQIKSMLYSMINAEKEIPVTKDAISTIVTLSKESRGIFSLGRSHRAKDLLLTALGRCRKSYDCNYIPPEIKEVNLSIDDMIEEGDQNKAFLYHKALQKKKKLTDEFREDQKIIQNVRSLFLGLRNLQQNYRKVFFELRNAITQKIENEVSEHSKKIYLIYDLFAANILQSLLDEEIVKIQSRRPVQVDKVLIETIFRELGENENKL